MDMNDGGYEDGEAYTRWVEAKEKRTAELEAQEQEYADGLRDTFGDGAVAAFLLDDERQP